MNIIISGLNGFVGKNLNSYLRKNNKISYYDFKKTDNDLTNIDVMIHLAGKAHDTTKGNQNEYNSINTDLTKIIYDKFVNSKINTFIMLSSIKAVADEEDVIIDELYLPRPKSYYGKSKLLAEQFILNYTLAVDKRFFILRPCMIHGPNNKGNLNSLYNYLQLGIPWPLGSFDNKRSYCSIENLCFIVNEIIYNKTIESGIYNIADDLPLSTNELVSNIGKSINKNIILLKIPIRVIKFFVIICEKLNIVLIKDIFYKLTTNLIVNNKKIKTAIKKDLPISSIEGLEITLNSFKNI
jgi:nucleoside-diphosphate-sugar epimerase